MKYKKPTHSNSYKIIAALGTATLHSQTVGHKAEKPT
jgi:hypothetical protein